MNLFICRNVDGRILGLAIHDSNLSCTKDEFVKYCFTEGWTHPCKKGLYVETEGPVDFATWAEVEAACRRSRTAEEIWRDLF